MSGPDPLWHESEGTISLWMPETDTLALAIVGKLGEEAAELSARCHRAIIQGLAGIDPKSGYTNLQELAREIADVKAAMAWACEVLRPMPETRSTLQHTARKREGFRVWQNLIADELTRQGK